jgi:hypothetical protein
VRRSLRFSPEAVAALRRIEREFVHYVWDVLDRLAADPTLVPFQPTEEDPSIYWAAVEGDYTVWFEILDEAHAIRVLDIED